MSRWLRVVSRSVALFGLFLRELVVSALAVSAKVLTPNLRLRPRLVAYPLTLTGDREITLLATLITLTPGTLSIDVSDDKKTLIVHVLDAVDDETVIGQIAAGFEARILELSR